MLLFLSKLFRREIAVIDEAELGEGVEAERFLVLDEPELIVPLPLLGLFLKSGLLLLEGVALVLLLEVAEELHHGVGI